jgi:hypothetical protein
MSPGYPQLTDLKQRLGRQQEDKSDRREMAIVRQAKAERGNATLRCRSPGFAEVLVPRKNFPINSLGTFLSERQFTPSPIFWLAEVPEFR